MDLLYCQGQLSILPSITPNRFAPSGLPSVSMRNAPALYYPHNIHFLWAASSMEGRSQVALEAARRVQANVALDMIEEYPSVEFFHTIPLLALTQFGRWEEVLAEPAPPENLDYSRAIRHYARGTAFARTKDLDSARAERAALVPLRDSAKVHFLDTVDYPASQLLLIADELLLGEMGMAEKKLDQAMFDTVWSEADVTLTASRF